MTMRFTKREYALIVGPLLLLALPYLIGVDWLGLPFRQSREEKYGHACQVNMQNVSMALRQYSQDFDGKYPLTASRSMTQNPIGWVDALIPYSGGGLPTLSICPAIGIERSFSPSERNYTTFWLNAHLSGIALKKVAFPHQTLYLGDGNDGTDLTNATYSKTALPPSWLKDINSPAYRHLGGANYLMVDGSVHWLQPQEVTTFGRRKNAFAIK